MQHARATCFENELKCRFLLPIISIIHHSKKILIFANHYTSGYVISYARVPILITYRYRRTGGKQLLSRWMSYYL